MDAAATLGRRDRRRLETRSRLLAAARELFAAQGVDATRVGEITERADVGAGSFYNHFEDKDAIVSAVLAEITSEQGEAVAALTAEVEDPAEVVAVAHRHFLRLAATDPVWCGLVIRLEASHGVLAGALGARAARDIERGMAAGRFDVADPVLALHTAGGALIGSMNAVRGGLVRGTDADVQHAEAVLRMLGLTSADAAEVARRPMPAAA